MSLSLKLVWLKVLLIGDIKNEFMKKEISEVDAKHYEMIRKNVSDFLERCGNLYDRGNCLVLDIAPQDHEGARAHFLKSKIETLDITPESGATYIADLCKNNDEFISSERFDIIVCTEVLEHTLRPFDAVDEIQRLLKKGGIALVTVPFNFRIHGPLPDCWRFSEHGIRALFSQFEILALTALEDEDRWLMPVHYTVIVQKPLSIL